VLDPDEATLTLLAANDTVPALVDTVPALVDTLPALLDTAVKFSVARAVVVTPVAPVTGPDPVTVVVRLTGPGPMGKVETLMGPTVAVPVVAGVVFAVRLYWAHRAYPMDATARSSVAGHEASRHDSTMELSAVWAGPHWQASSDSAQPALEMAEVRQAVAQAGSLPKFWAVERVRRVAVVVRVRRVSFMVEEVVVVVG
jgi:hypothetical protein